MQKNLLLLSGPTYEYIDPVRFIGNASSGKMGASIAVAAKSRGWFVNFITGPVHPYELPKLGSKGNIKQITSTLEMFEEAKKYFFDSNVIIFAAAISDLTPVKKSTIKNEYNDKNSTLELKSTIDIAKHFGEIKQEEQITIGFALQTHDSKNKANQKRKDKNLDAIILNFPEAIGRKSAEYTWIDEKSCNHLNTISKDECASLIIEYIEKKTNK